MSTKSPPVFSALRRKTFTSLVKLLTATNLIAGGAGRAAGIVSVLITIEGLAMGGARRNLES